MTNIKSPEQTSVEAVSPMPANRLDNLPYDLRYMIWLATFDDESRVVLAHPSVEPREITPPNNNDYSPSTAHDLGLPSGLFTTSQELENSKERFDVYISAHKQSAISLAKFFLSREIEKNPGFIRDLLERKVVRSAIRNSKNVHFIQDLRMFAKAMIHMFEKNADHYFFPGSRNDIKHASSPVSMVSAKKIVSISIEAWPIEVKEHSLKYRRLRDGLNDLLETIYHMSTLKTIYLVQDNQEDPKAFLTDSPRFRNPLRQEIKTTRIEEQMKTEKVVRSVDVERYQITSRTRDIIQEVWREVGMNQLFDLRGRPCPTVKIVAWEMVQGDDNWLEKAQKRNLKQIAAE